EEPGRDEPGEAGRALQASAAALYRGGSHGVPARAALSGGSREEGARLRADSARQLHLRRRAFGIMSSGGRWRSRLAPRSSLRGGGAGLATGANADEAT